jgi:exodeoxyribonuclease V
MTVHPKLTAADLSEDQREAYAAVKSWLNRGAETKQVLSLAGFAGSGKSTVVSVLAHELPAPMAFVAFTGKASSVLGRKLKESGITTGNRISKKNPLGPRPYCGTIHGLIYAPCDGCMIEENFGHNHGPDCEESSSEGEDGNIIEEVFRDTFTGKSGPNGECLACHPPPPKKLDGPCQKCNGERFFRRSKLDRDYRLITLDEASMVDDHMLRDLLSYGIPLLAVGDHGQLPPIKGQGSLMKSPDLRLEKIHRQAAGNPIIALAAYIREHGDTSEDFADGDRVTFISRRDLDKWIDSRFQPSRLQADPRTPEGILGTVLVSYTNKQRVALNDRVRQALSLSGESPKRGEAMICLKNKAPIYNGMRGVLLYDAITAGSKKSPQWKTDIDFVDNDIRSEGVRMAEAQFFREKTIDMDGVRELGIPFSQLGELYDFGYAMTCHKMQGSSAYEVAVLYDGLRNMSRHDRTAWVYTSVTRAQAKLTIVCG